MSDCKNNSLNLHTFTHKIHNSTYEFQKNNLNVLMCDIIHINVKIV